MSRLTAFVVALVLSVSSGFAQGQGEAGRFDYYVLALSWSPTWCGTKAGREDTQQCGGLRRYGFIVHGLWPQYGKGGFPARCAAPSPLSPKLVEDMLPLMPSRSLIEHEWAKHGTCAGGGPEAYFATAKAARARVVIPAPLGDPSYPRQLPVAEIERLFVGANPGLAPDGIAVTCLGRQVAEVRLCLDRQLEFRPCGRDVRDRCNGDAFFPAAR